MACFSAAAEEAERCELSAGHEPEGSPTAFVFYTSSFRKMRSRLRRRANAFGVEAAPMLLILDDLTNHPDLHDIAALEAYDRAVLAVSYGEAFLKALGPDRTIELPL